MHLEMKHVHLKSFLEGISMKIIDKRDAARLELHNRKENKVYRYKIVAFTATGAESQPAKPTYRHSILSKK